MKYLRLIPVAVLILALSACDNMLTRFSSDPTTRKAELPHAVDGFNKALTWNSFSEALPFVDRIYHADFMKDIKRFKKAKITEVNLESHEFDREAEVASVVTMIKYVAVPSYTIQTVEYAQSWAFRPAQGGWLLESGQFRLPSDDEEETEHELTDENPTL